MSKKIVGDDGVIASEVGEWAKTKHDYLRRYLDISKAARKKWLGPNKAGATFVDFFCGPGRARVRETGEWIDGSAIAAWKISLEGGAPFSEIYVGDLDDENRQGCVKRLRDLGAPVIELSGPAVEAVNLYVQMANPYGLHFAFVDPFNLGALDFRIIEKLSSLKRVDMLLHISKMDHQRNLEQNTAEDGTAYDLFAPNWREHVDLHRSQQTIRQEMIKYWHSLVSNLGIDVPSDMKLITGSRNQHLYWLLLVAKHELALKFWKVAASPEQQGELF